MASKSTDIRNALESYAPWLESLFKDDVAEIVQLRFDQSIAALAAHRLLGVKCRTALPLQACELLDRRLDRIEFPPGVVPAAALRLTSIPGSLRQWSANWLDCPIAMYLSGISGPVIAANVPYVDGLYRCSEWREVVLLKREDIPALLTLLEEAFSRDRTMKVMGENDVSIQPLTWDELVLDESVIRLVKNDFDLFLRREQWFKDHRLPFRRGYLFHGPPGNGKSSVIRAMLSMQGISGFTLNPFRPFEEDIVAAMFREAAESTPAIIVLEDLDRCYPTEREKEPESRIPLQQLLNHLDGVGSQNGIVVVATANNPSILDAAVLRRPGRFDRVIGFPNPSEVLRERYLRHMYAPLANRDLTECVRMTAGFSFAQLREAYILAGQIALEEDSPIDSKRIARAAHSLTQSMVAADRKWNSAVGFREALSADDRAEPYSG